MVAETRPARLRWEKMYKFITLFIVIIIILLIWKLESLSPAYKKPEKYSRKNILLFYAYTLIISLVASLIVYHFTESFKVAAILFGIFTAFIAGGGIKSIYSGYCKKHRRSEKL